MKAIFTSLCLAFLLIANQSCMKSKVTYSGTIHRGRIINEMCGQITVQLTDSSMFGQYGWADQGKVYDRVFKIQNPCTWHPDRGAVPDTFKFSFAAPSTQSCTQCMALGHTPDVAYSIQFVP